MGDFKIKERMRLVCVANGDQYRVLTVSEGTVITCKINIETLEVFYFPQSKLEKEIQSGVYEFFWDDFTILDTDNYFKNSDEEVRKKQIELFRKYKTICTSVYDEYKYRLHELTVQRKTKKLVKSLCEQYNVSRQTFWKYFTRYLQSGFDDISLTDQRGRKRSYSENRKVSAGRKKSNGKEPYLLTEEDKKKIRKFLKSYLSSEVKSKENVYLDLCYEYYSVKVNTLDENGNVVPYKQLLPADERPSRRQIFYFINENSSKQERKEAKETETVVRNDSRVFTGTVMDGVRGPGHYVEMDAQEMDIALISEEYPMIPVGRPILYAMIDVMSELILAVSLAMDNNSIVGCTNCMLNLIEDKTQVLKRHGIELNFNEGVSIDDVWPTNVKPKVIKYDNGSDFISIPIARILEELNIRAEFVSPGSGSLKPLVENLFGTIKRDLDDLLEHKGLIRPVYGSDHHEEACLMYEDAYKLVLNDVV